MTDMTLRRPAAARRRARATVARALVGLGAALSMALSVTLWFGGDEQQALFVGLWVPSVLAAGALFLPREERR